MTAAGSPTQPPQLNLKLTVSLEDAVRDASADAVDGRIAERIWAGDDTVFGPAGQPEVADRLGWLHAPQRSRGLLEQLDTLAASSRERGDRVVLVLGMGGSSLAPEVLANAFNQVTGGPQLRVLDSTVPSAALEAAGDLDPEHTLVIASSKSGSTVETRSQLELLWTQLDETPDSFAVVTDPGSAFEAIARQRGFRAVVYGDPEVGGRYSALTAFGLAPAAAAGIDVRALLDSGAAAAGACTQNDPATNIGLQLGLVLGEAARAGRDKLTILADASLGGAELWLEQLIAESTGKQGKGILPVTGDRLGDRPRFGDDRIVLRVRDTQASGGGAGSPDEVATALQAAGAPLAELAIDGPTALGGLFFVTEFATAVAGWRLGINPFDQPNVQEAKDATRDVLAESASSPDLPAVGTAEAISRLLDRLEAPGYAAVLGYLAPSPSVDQAAQRLQCVIRDLTGAATTFGYGPRYLHSTGQLHKGGPEGGRFLIVVDDSAPDVDIPGSEFTFRRLMHAQALGDLRALHAHGRTAVLVTTGGAPAETLHELADRAVHRPRA